MNIKFAIDFRLTLIIIEVFSFSEYAIFFSREHLSSFNLNFITRFFFLHLFGYFFHPYTVNEVHYDIVVIFFF